MTSYDIRYYAHIIITPTKYTGLPRALPTKWTFYPPIFHWKISRVKVVDRKVLETGNFRFSDGNFPSDSNATHFPCLPTMPLVKVFARAGMNKARPLVALQSRLCEIWGTKPETTKLMLSRVEDWTDDHKEDCYVDIRAYGKSERTRDFVLDGMKKVQNAFAEFDLAANIRLETYDGEKYFHVPPWAEEVECSFYGNALPLWLEVSLETGIG